MAASVNEVQQQLVERIALALIDPACPHFAGMLSYNEALEVARFIVMGDES